MKFTQLIVPISALLLGCSASTTKEEPLFADVQEELNELSVAYFASGCFWCAEAIFELVEGVSEAISGYSGGDAKDANYKAVSSGKTGHAETVAVYYDPEIVDYSTLLVVFFDSHDPTTKNQQGPDIGPQYRSAIFYTNEQEKIWAENYIRKLLDEGVFPKITTTIEEFSRFYPAEKYHQNFKEKNPDNPYVKGVSKPRLEKFQKKQPDLLKKD